MIGTDLSLIDTVEIIKETAIEIEKVVDLQVGTREDLAVGTEEGLPVEKGDSAGRQNETGQGDLDLVQGEDMEDHKGGTATPKTTVREMQNPRKHPQTIRVEVDSSCQV